MKTQFLQYMNPGKARFYFSVFTDSTEMEMLLPILVPTFRKSWHKTEETQTGKN